MGIRSSLTLCHTEDGQINGMISKPTNDLCSTVLLFSIDPVGTVNTHDAENEAVAVVASPLSGLGVGTTRLFSCVVRPSGIATILPLPVCVVANLALDDPYQHTMKSR